MTYLEDLFSLGGKGAVVTGGAGVLGTAMVEALVKAGASVCIWSAGVNHPVDEAVQRLTDTTGAQGRIFGVAVDTADRNAVSDALEKTEYIMGPVSLLVNGAGGNRGKGPLLDADPDAFQAIMKLNLVAGFLVPTQVVARHWIEKGKKGAIINVSSMAAYVPLSGVWAYGAAKAGVMNLTMAAAKEFAPHGIRVNAVAPGFFVTAQNRDLLLKDEAKGILTERGESVIARTPFGRFGNPRELAGALLYLASDQASGFVTGVTIPVDGGFLVDNI